MHKTPKIITNKKFFDKRGFLTELSGDIYIKKNKIKNILVTSSKKNVLRGFHFQRKKPINQIVTCIKGKILDVVVDLRKKSKTFGKVFTLHISDNSEFSFFIPAGFAHGFLCLSKKCTIYYKCTHYQNKNSEQTLSWNDKKLKIKWPIKKPILSKKDKKGLSFEEIKKLI